MSKLPGLSLPGYISGRLWVRDTVETQSSGLMAWLYDDPM
jgi:hypothetical protein